VAFVILTIVKTPVL